MRKPHLDLQRAYHLWKNLLFKLGKCISRSPLPTLSVLISEKFISNNMFIMNKLSNLKDKVLKLVIKLKDILKSDITLHHCETKKMCWQMILLRKMLGSEICSCSANGSNVKISSNFHDSLPSIPGRIFSLQHSN